MKLVLISFLLISTVAVASEFEGNFAPKAIACGWHIEDGGDNSIILEAIDNPITDTTCFDYSVLIARCKGRNCKVDGASDTIKFLPDGNMIYSGPKRIFKNYRY